MSKISEKFSKASKSYLEYAIVQNEIAEILLKEINLDFFKNLNSLKVLDIGCGPGNFTKLLNDKIIQNINNYQIFAFDISEEMIKVAQQNQKIQINPKIFFFNSDGENFEELLKIQNNSKELIFCVEEKFDIIASNSTIQWFKNFEKVLHFYTQFLNNKGIFIFSAFGNRTFYELNESLKEFYKYKNQNEIVERNIVAKTFLNKAGYEEILERFCLDKKGKFNFKIKEIDIKKRFLNIKDLLINIKNTGTNINETDRKRVWTKKDLELLEEIYRRLFSNEIIVTYNLIFCEIYKS